MLMIMPDLAGRVRTTATTAEVPGALEERTSASVALDPVRVDDRMRIPLSVPHLTGGEAAAMARAVSTNWVASVGPELAAFEAEFAQAVGTGAALATTSATAALHLALRVLGVGPGDEVLVSTLTFCASVNPILYLGAQPVFVDSEVRSWNIDPAIVADELNRRGRSGRLPAAVLVVHLYGQIADMTPLLEVCRMWGVPVVEDAAEALGAAHHESSAVPRAAGTMGDLGVYSFDGSKMITTSIGGMLVSNRPELVDHARKLARQAREPVAHYEHTEIGYNYRMSNLLAAFGRVQLSVLPARVAARRAVCDAYREDLQDVPGIAFQPEASWGSHARWLTCITIDPAAAGTTAEALRQILLLRGIESRPLWKPMHRQPVYQQLGLQYLGGGTADHLFATGLCLPSSSSLHRHEIAEVGALLRSSVAQCSAIAGRA
jgi:dTDP-4-amino-4,6-dideoxygalactose transaminase